jgi:poly(A) polymerase
MPETPPPIPSKQPSDREDAIAVVRRLREAGHVAYFAGGCVRDELLGITPKDYDVATDAPPPRVRELFSNTQAVGAAFGVILVRHRKSVIEVATFRADDVYLDGRRPSKVHFTTAEEDAKRRDFTINGLFLDPVENKVIDYVGGQEDLKKEIIRAIGDPNHRFEEDHLRLLRAIRFAARFQFEIEQETSAALQRHAAQLKRISPERIADELRLMLTLPDVSAFWACYALLDLYPTLSDVIFRFLGPAPDRSDQSTIRIIESFPQRWWPFPAVLAALTLEWLLLQPENNDVSLLLSHEIVQRIIHALRQSLRLSNDELADIAGTLEGVGMLIVPETVSDATVKRFLARRAADWSRMLLEALKCHVGAWRVDTLNHRLDELSKTEFAPPPLITGDDLTSAGLQPGKLFKRILDEVYDAQLEGQIHTKEEAMRQAMLIAQQK